MACGEAAAPNADRSSCRCLDSNAQFVGRSCMCKPGFTRAEGAGACTACATGSYKPLPGDAACSACPAHSSSKQVAATDRAVCLCNAGKPPSEKRAKGVRGAGERES